MAVQTVYNEEMAVGFAGGIANEEPRTLISRNVEAGAGDGIKFGLAVMQGTNDRGCVVSDGSGFLGVTIRDNSVGADFPDGFAELTEARIMTEGVCWVANSGGVDAGDPVEVMAAGALGTGTGNIVENARWDTTAANGELAKLRLVGGGVE